MCVCFKLCLPLTYKKEHREDNFPKDVGVSTILKQADLSEFEPNLVLHREFQASQGSKPNQNNNNTSKRALSLSDWGDGSVVKSICCSDSSRVWFPASVLGDSQLRIIPTLFWSPWVWHSCALVHAPLQSCACVLACAHT